MTSSWKIIWSLGSLEAKHINHMDTQRHDAEGYQLVDLLKLKALERNIVSNKAFIGLFRDGEVVELMLI
jgi:hypothetical protein